ncbi:MAG TPA: hypothetical protein VJM14_19065 [Burkholderiales bacterium]|nr:hypothetical protein [Burkholderiales bacterium]
MKARTVLGFVFAAALGAAGYAVAHDRADRALGSGMMGGGMMGGGMAGMMDGCRDMMQGGSAGQPNTQWGDRARKVPPAKTEKPQ